MTLYFKMSMVNFSLILLINMIFSTSAMFVSWHQKISLLERSIPSYYERVGNWKMKSRITAPLFTSSLSITTTRLSKTHKSKSYTSRDLQEIIDVAERAAYSAGKIMKDGLSLPMSVDFKTSSSDLVTQFDLQCQQTIKKIISSEFPDDRFLGEEEVDAGSLASITALKKSLLLDDKIDTGESSKQESLLWIVDPIDGTTNFQAGLPLFCTSIGVVSITSRHVEVIAGVIYNPILNEMVTSAKGRGCYMNGKLLQTSGRQSIDDVKNNEGIALSEAVVNVGFPVYSEATLEVSSRAVSTLAKRVRGLRMIASASQVMSWVAQGKFNAYVSWDLNAWDIAAGLLIVDEAGGYCQNFDGSKASISSRDLIITCNENIEDMNECDEYSYHPLGQELRLVLKETNCLVY